MKEVEEHKPQIYCGRIDFWGLGDQVGWIK